MGAVPAIASTMATPRGFLPTVHTNPQVVIERLPLHLTGIASPPKKRLLFSLAARRGGSGWDSGRRSHLERTERRIADDQTHSVWRGKKEDTVRMRGGKRRSLELEYGGSSGRR